MVYLQITDQKKSNILVQMPMTISELKLSINNINARTDKNNIMTINLGVNINNTKEIDILISKLKQLTLVNNVFRTTSIC